MNRLIILLLRALQLVFCCVGLVILSWVLFTLAAGYLFQTLEEAALEREIHEGAAPVVGPAPRFERARLEVPRLGASVMVAPGVDEQTLSLAAGWIPKTALPGQSGNVGIAAHRDTHFRALKDIQRQDLITLTSRERKLDYEVEWVRIVEPNTVEVLEPTGEPSLTLVTCYPFSFVGRAPQRFVIRARQVREVVFARTE